MKINIKKLDADAVLPTRGSSQEILCAGGAEYTDDCGSNRRE